MSQPSLENQVALVTGASRGIGAGVAAQLANAGAHVVVNYNRSEEAALQLVEAIRDAGSQAWAVSGDVADAKAVDAMIGRVLDEHGRLDILVNNAGYTKVIPHKDLDAVTDDVFRRIIDVNLMGTWYLSRAAMAALKESGDGSIVNVTSVAGVRPVGSSIPYAVSKAALNHLTKLMANVSGPEVRVNAVAPGLVRTPWTDDWDELHAGMARATPLGRSAEPDDVADTVMGVLRSRYLTGEVVVLDGGLQLR